MDNAACNVIYVDRAAGQDRLAKRQHALESRHDEPRVPGIGELGPGVASQNINALLETFSEVFVCTSGQACVSKLLELHDAASIVDLTPTVVLIDIPHGSLPSGSESYNQTPSPSSARQDRDPPGTEFADERFYGLPLLQWIVSDIQQQRLPKLVVPVAMVSIPEPDIDAETPFKYEPIIGPSISMPSDQMRTLGFLDVGAADVLTSPLIRERLPGLAVHAYQAYKDLAQRSEFDSKVKKQRKRSWVGLDGQKPYAYLREAMVSGLMDGICGLDDAERDSISNVQIFISDERHEEIIEAIASWDFSAHDFTDDELIHGAKLMLEHALSMPGLEQWRIPAEDIKTFLVACKAAYNSFVPYHNFRHVIDVLQACFHFLTRIGAIPLFPTNSGPKPMVPIPTSPVSVLLMPFDSLTLLLTAIGHDVGHPGVNNAFLITLNAPLAQLYNDRSVLESFHCAAYSQILRRHWPATFSSVEMRKLMISSILATDMGLHFDYMKKMGFLQEKLAEDNDTKGWNGRTREEYRTLACSLLIKCADISNVARRYDVAAKWTMILTDEFARQASMEADLGIPSALFAPPVREIVELGHSQIGFMNMFALPLFQGVSDLVPGMEFCVEKLQKNRSIWQEKIEIEQQRRKHSEDSLARDETFSPGGSIRGSVSLGHGQGPALLVNGSSSANASSRSSRLEGARHNALIGIKGGYPYSTVEQTPSPKSAPVDFQSSDLPDGERMILPGYNLPKPAKTQVSSTIHVPYSTTSAPALLGHLDKGTVADGTTVAEPSLVTEAVLFSGTLDSAVRPDSKQSTGASQSYRISDVGNGSNSTSNTTDWQSQATSATTNKHPISPSTQGTSITSNDSNEKASVAAAMNRSSMSRGCPVSSSADGASDPKKSPDTIMDTMRSIAKKPSRSRFRFWKKKNNGKGDSALTVPPSNGSAAGGPEGLDRVSIKS